MKATVRFNVTGLNQLKFLNELYKQGVFIRDLDRQNQKYMFFSVKAADKSKVISLLDRQGYCYSIISETSFSKSLLSCLPRLGLVFGVLAMFAISVIAYSRLWKIEVSGNQRIDELTIIRTLKQTGITVGGKKDFDCDLVEETLMSLDDVSAVTAQIFGTTLKVEILESTLTTGKDTIGDVISLYDAEVVRIVVNSGSPTVKIGDRIPAGTTLIEGVEYNTEGLPLFEVNAQGEVYGKVNFTYTETASLATKNRTGNSKSYVTLKLFGRNIGKEQQDIYKNYETEKTVTKIGSLLPIYAQTTRCYEIDIIEITLEELMQNITSKAVNNLIICAGGSAISTTSSAKLVSGNVYRITVHIEAEVSIGGKRID